MPFDGNDDIDVEFRSVKIKEFLQLGESFKMRLSTGTQETQERLTLEFKASAEIEIVPGPFDEARAIINQIQLFGKERGTGQGRKRISLTILNDSDKGEAFYIDSTVTEGSPSSLDPMPVVHRLGENGIDVVIHADKSIELKSYEKDTNGNVITTAVRRPATKWIAAMEATPE